MPKRVQATEMQSSQEILVELQRFGYLNYNIAHAVGVTPEHLSRVRNGRTGDGGPLNVLLYLIKTQPEVRRILGL